MEDSDEPLDSERRRQLRLAMTADETTTLFNRDPQDLSKDEAAVLYIETRERIRVFEAKAQRKRDEEGTSNEP